MKEPSQDFIDNEEEDQRKPIEIYHIWRDGGEHWRYNNGDKLVTYDGDDYPPGLIERGSVTYDNKLDVTSMTIKADYVNEEVFDYIASNPVEILWVSVLKLHSDDLTEGDVVFIGQIKNVSFQGQMASVTCVGFEHFLKKTIPTWRYQLTCNHKVFDGNCQLTAASYLTTTTIVLDSSGINLVSADFGAESDGYFIGGEVLFGDESRTVVGHEGNTITLMYKMKELVTASSVDVYPGCDGRVETCRDKYSNVINFLGFPFIPVENPALRVSW